VSRQSDKLLPKFVNRKDRLVRDHRFEAGDSAGILKYYLYLFFSVGSVVNITYKADPG
jgi:hypothetical protein